MNITFFLVRHAIKERVIGDVPITPQGILQAELTARSLCNFPISIILTSPLRRANQTAEYISKITKASISEDNRLRERVNWGDLPGQTYDEFVAMWERSTREPEYVPPVGDSVEQASERLSAMLSEIVKKYPSKSNIVIVTHGGLITDFLVHTFPESHLSLWHPNFTAEQSELIPECSITSLIYESGKYHLQNLASVEHLK